MDSIERARAFVEASTAGRWAEAAGYVAEGVLFVFPSGTYVSLEALRVGLGGRYRDLSKQFETWDLACHADGSVVVICAGTLAGVNLFDVPFSGVRFLDRLVLRDGLVVGHQVYNDLASSGVLRRRDLHGS